MKSVKFRKKKKKWFNPIEVIYVFLMLKVFPIVQKKSLQDVRKLRWYFGLLLCYQLWKYHRSRLNSSFLGLFLSAGRYNYESSDKPVSLQDDLYKICTRSTSSWQCWNDVSFQKRRYWQPVWHYGYLWIIPKKFVYILDVSVYIERDVCLHL